MFQNYLQHINFLPTGIYFKTLSSLGYKMISDVDRNLFYEKIISENVKDKDCIDPSFGTGMLSILALKHGAKSITAYEMDENIYEVGLSIIKDLKLSDKIQLQNKKFKVIDHYFEKPYTVIQEFMDSLIYGEDLYENLRGNKNLLTIIPGNFIAEIYCCEIDNSEFLQIKNLYKKNFPFNQLTEQNFNSGLNIDTQYNLLIDNLIKNYINFNTNYFLDLNFIKNKEIIVNHLLKKSKKFSQYHIDINNLTLQIDSNNHNYKISLNEIPEIISNLPLPEYKENLFVHINFLYGYNNNFQKIYTNTNNSHWSNFTSFIIDKNLNYKSIEQNLKNGRITFT